MSDQNLFSKGFPTNRIKIVLPSSGQTVLMRETTVVELKSMCKTVIDNLANHQMDVIYDSFTEYLQTMMLTDGVDVWSFQEIDRIFCLLIFFQMSFFKEPTQYKCDNCGVDVIYRYDMSRYISGIETAYVCDQVVTVQHKSRKFEIVIGWPTVKELSNMNSVFYQSSDGRTEESERTKYGINFIMSFIKDISIIDSYTNQIDMHVNLTELSWDERADIINSLPSTVIFDAEDGVFGKITGFFINRFENCFGFEKCPQCGHETYYGLGQSSHFTSLFCGMIKSIYGFILQVECLLLYRYDCCIFDKEQYMTYNDLSSLIHQIGNTAEKENAERKKAGNDHLYKGLWYIREILNNLIFPQDKKN